MGSLHIFCAFLLVAVSAVYCDEEIEKRDTDSNEPEHSWNWKQVEDYLKNKGSFACPSVYGRYPHPKECTLYYECRFSVPHLMQCSHGKLYDEKQEQCLDKRVSNCNRCCKDGDDDNGGKDDKTFVFRCPYIWGTFAHPFDCSKYFECVYNVPTLYQCDGTDLFDTKIQKCNEKSKVDCGDRLDRDQLQPTTTQPTTTTVRPTTGENKFVCPFPSGRFPDPHDCSQFYECRFSVPSVYKCPVSTLYDERTESCLPEKYVKCGNRPGGRGGRDDDESKGKIGDIRCPCTWGTFYHPDDCSKYMVCIYNVPTIFSCRKNELFHVYHKRCLPSHLVTCGKRINPDDFTPPPTTTTPLTTPTTTTTPEPTTTTPEPTTTTPEPTTTTPEPTTTTPEPTTTTPEPTTTIRPTNQPKPNTPPPTTCDEDDIDCIEDQTKDVKDWFDCPDRFGHFPHSGHKQLFIHCDNWRPFIKRCNVETYFSPEFLVCVWGKDDREIPFYTQPQ